MWTRLDNCITFLVKLVNNLKGYDVFNIINTVKCLNLKVQYYLKIKIKLNNLKETTI